jgi:hemerythrin-like domain-containing protein
MMLATDLLRSEHRVIEQVLSCLAKVANDCDSQRKLDGVIARQILDFFHIFADQCHHMKEEQQLFPLLELRGFSPSSGPTEVLRGEHDLGRRLLQGLSEAIPGAALGNTDACQRFVNLARGYIHLIREHIVKEDARLFPMASELLTDDDQHALLEAFEKVENKEMHAATHEKYLRLADDLAERLGLAHFERTCEHAHSCCGHAVAK